jgi:hemerythrin
MQHKEQQEDKPFVEWDESYSVWIPLIDAQHKELFRMTNDLYSACLESGESAGSRFREAVHETVNYVKFHFGAEEQMLTKAGYPTLDLHQQEHQGFIKEILKEVKDFESGQRFVPNNFVRYLRDWILAHIGVSDKKYARYIADLKQKGLAQDI